MSAPNVRGLASRGSFDPQKAKQAATLATASRPPTGNENSDCSWRHDAIRGSALNSSRKVTPQCRVGTTATANSSSHQEARPPPRVRGPWHGGKSQAGTYGAMSGMMGAKENQDGYFVQEDEGTSDFFVGVMDGHGMAGRRVSDFLKGHLGGKTNSMHVLRASDKTAPESLKKHFKETADQLRKSGVEAHESGSTAVTVLKKGKELYVANVGDSRCIVAKEITAGRLQAIPLSDDHKPDRNDEKARIQRHGGKVEPIRHGNRFMGPARLWKQAQAQGGLAVSRAFGDLALAPVGLVAEPEIRKETISDQHKFLVLASDGVWEHMSNQQVVDVAKQFWDKDPTKASDAIVKEARKQWQQKGQGYIDDITALVVKV